MRCWVTRKYAFRKGDILSVILTLIFFSDRLEKNKLTQADRYVTFPMQHIFLQKCSLFAKTESGSGSCNAP